MKREETIMWLIKPTITCAEISVSKAKELEAYDMAIEALSREQRKYDAICDELLELKSDLSLPIEVAMAYEKSIAVVSKYAKMGGSK